MDVHMDTNSSLPTISCYSSGDASRCSSPGPLSKTTKTQKEKERREKHRQAKRPEQQTTTTTTKAQTSRQARATNHNKTKTHTAPQEKESQDKQNHRATNDTRGPGICVIAARLIHHTLAKLSQAKVCTVSISSDKLKQKSQNTNPSKSGGRVWYRSNHERD